ncbi:MAG: DUF4149 domain-containing protein [Congregibacter sp.]|nr:DUF4149 domain-containing protein [Congregibacter sp.]MDP5069546.1 DUF4149 domain-containing protein [Congregibacter sp.]
MNLLSWQLAAAQLMVAFLFGGSLLYSSTFAAFLFKTLPPSEAGILLRKAFTQFYLWLFATSLISALLLVSIDPGSSLILAVIALITVPLREQLMPAINAASDAGDRQRFQRLHLLSVFVGLCQIAAMAVVLLRAF